MKQIKCRLEQSGILVPDNNGNEIAVISIDPLTTGSSKTGKISFAGSVQAFLTFDLTGTKVAAYQITDFSPNSYKTQQSVENIIKCI